MPSSKGLDTFVEKWSSSAAAERANYQSFLIELCSCRPDGGDVCAAKADILNHPINR